MLFRKNKRYNKDVEICSESTPCLFKSVSGNNKKRDKMFPFYKIQWLLLAAWRINKTKTHNHEKDYLFKRRTYNYCILLINYNIQLIGLHSEGLRRRSYIKFF